MKIIFLDFDDIKNPLLGAGQAKASYEVGSLLSKRGHVVEVICSKYPKYEDRIDNGISYKHIGLGSKNIRLNNAAYILSIPLYVSFLKADIIIECFTAPISTLCSQLFTKIPVVGLPTSFEAERFSKLYKFPFDRIQNWGLKTYKYFLPYTKYFDQKMRAVNPKIISKIVPEGVGDEFFTYPRKTPKYILFIGRYDMGQKGIDLLIKAYAKIANKVSYPLVLAGHGPDEMRIRSLIGRLKLRDKITVHGSAFGSVKKKLLSEALFVAFPSRHEGFSLFSLEALASGLALVGFDIPGLFWTNKNVALKAKPYDIDEYAQLLHSMTNSQTAEKMGKASREFARNYTWENVANQFELFFTKILKTN